MAEKENNYYINQLNEQHIAELYSRIKVHLEYKGEKYPVDYVIFTPNVKFKVNNTKTYCTLFLKDFTCSMSRAPKESKEGIQKIYRQFMLEVFEGTNYKADAEEFDIRKAERLSAIEF